MSEYGSSFATPALDQSLLPHLHTDPDAMTYAQGQEHLANQQTEMTKQAQDIVNRQQVSNERDQQLKAIQGGVQQQLVATGRYTPDQAKQYAALHSAFYDNASERMGVTPAEMHERMPLKITGDALGGGFNQDPNSYYDERVDNNKQGLTDGNEEHVIEGTVAKRSEAEVDHEQNEFLSNFQKGQRYARSNPRLAGLRESSDQAAHELGGNPEAGRVVKERLGPFSEYKTAGQVIAGRTPAEDKLQVHVYGKEQNEAGLTDTPALTLTVDKSGELTINGPHYLSDDLNEFIARGWADHAVGKDGEIQHGWTRLQNPDSPNKQLPFEQLKPLLADMHARLLAWDDKEYAGLHWGRATGATGGDGEGRKTAVFFQPAYHGSPHDFNKFSLDHIGSGEGHQSYGHGLYFAEHPDVAKMYQKSLADFDMKVDGKDYNNDIPEHRAALIMHEAAENGHSREDVIARLDRSIADFRSRGKGFCVWRWRQQLCWVTGPKSMSGTSTALKFQNRYRLSECFIGLGFSAWPGRTPLLFISLPVSDTVWLTILKVSPMKPKDMNQHEHLVLDDSEMMEFIQALVVSPDQLTPEGAKQALAVLQAKFAPKSSESILNAITRDPLVLDEQELIRISGYKVPKLQCDYFNKQGVPAHLNGINRCIVQRKHYQVIEGPATRPPVQVRLLKK